MEILELEVNARNRLGKGPSRQLRRQGQVPAVFYAPGEKAIPAAVDAKELHAKVGAARGMHLIKLKSGDASLADRVVLVKELQVHPVSHALLHADFYQVDMTKKTRVRVPLEFVGKAEGVVLGGILQPIEREVEISCLPMEIPESIPIDVTQMKIGESIHLSEILMPPGVEAVYDTDSAVVIIAAPTVEEPAAAAAAEETPAEAPEAKKEAETKEPAKAT